MRRAIVDTGPLVAFLNRRDGRHEWALEVLGGAVAPMLTCEAVLSEACFLLRNVAGGADAVLRLCEEGVLDVRFGAGAHASRVRALMKRYADVPMSLADACLVRLSELHPAATVVTFDSDFRVYRRNGRQVVPVAMPPPT
ncbi:MAG: pilus assembly protein [Deltaproteobacteria bacterium RBG_16_71_12]|nr:MAG: pilus assembly protein [Deltaproteobacteria bacterium RBG_16_71_12]